MKIDIKKHKQLLNELWTEETLYGGGRRSETHQKEALALLNNKLFIADVKRIRKEFFIEFTEGEKERLHAYYSEGSLQEIAEDFGDERSEIYFTPEKLDESLLSLKKKYHLSLPLSEAVRDFILLDSPLVKWPKNKEVISYEDHNEGQKGFFLPSYQDYLKNINDEGFRIELRDGRLFIELFYHTQKKDICGEDRLGRSVWKTRIQPLQRKLKKPTILPVALSDEEIEVIESLWKGSEESKAKGKKGISYQEMADTVNDMRLQKKVQKTFLEGKSKREIQEAALHNKTAKLIYDNHSKKLKSSDAIKRDISRLRKMGTLE